MQFSVALVKEFGLTVDTVMITHHAPANPVENILSPNPHDGNIIFVASTRSIQGFGDKASTKTSPIAPDSDKVGHPQHLAEKPSLMKRIMQKLRKMNSTLRIKGNGYSKGRGEGIPSVIVCDLTKGHFAEEQKVDDDDGLDVRDVHVVVNCEADNDEEHKSESSIDGDSVKYSSLLMLLESDYAQDTQYGMQRLVTLANAEFVNSETKGSVAEAIVLNVDTDAAERLRRSFLRHLNSDVLRLAALRVLTSTLELAKMQMRGRTNSLEVDFASRHWGGLLTALAYTTEVEEIERAEATLLIKCLRLVLSLDSTTTVDAYIRDSLLSYIQDCYRQACEGNDRRLQREASGMLSSLDIHWTEVCS